MAREGCVPFRSPAPSGVWVLRHATVRKTREAQLQSQSVALRAKTVPTTNARPGVDHCRREACPPAPVWFLRESRSAASLPPPLNGSMIGNIMAAQT